MKNDVCMCNISMEREICCLHDGIKTSRLHNLINHNTNLCDPWLRTLEQNYFQTCWKLIESKIYVIHLLISEYNYKYIFVKIEMSKMSEFSNSNK